MRLIERLLRRYLTHKEIGWPEIQEKFTRYTLLKTRWLTIYIHQLEAPIPHVSCHTHPWHFWAFIISGGYWESHDGRRPKWRPRGSAMYRTARTSHNVWTNSGDVNWSICVMSKKVRDWGFTDCQHYPPLLETSLPEPRRD